MWRMFRDSNYDPIDRCSCPDLEKAATNADRYQCVTKVVQNSGWSSIDTVSAWVASLC